MVSAGAAAGAQIPLLQANEQMARVTRESAKVLFFMSVS
jgi:hypothetical protein